MNARPEKTGEHYSSGDEPDREHYSSEEALDRDLFKARLRSVIPTRGENGFARRAQISASGLRGALKSGNPGRVMLLAIARTAGVSLQWLATGEGPMRPEAPSPTPGAGRAAAQTQHQGVTEGGAPPALQAVPTGDASVKAAVALAVTALGDHSQTIRPERLADLIDAAHQALQAGTDPALVRRLIAAAANP